jgi:hypothetical protein
MATIVITTKNDNLFTLTVGVKAVDMPKTFIAKEASGGRVKIEGIGNDIGDLYKSIHFSEIEIDAVTYGTINETISALNAIVFSKAGSTAPPTIKCYGEMHIDFTAPSTTTITSGTPVLIQGWSEGLLLGITHSNGRLTNTSGETKLFLVNSSLSVHFDTNNSELLLDIYKGGVSIPKAEIYDKVAVGLDKVNAGHTLLVSLDNNEYIELYVDSDKSGDFTIDAANINLIQI